MLKCYKDFLQILEVFSKLKVAKMSKETSKETHERMQTFDCRKEIEKDEQEEPNDKDDKRRR